MRKPKALVPGATVGVISPASPPDRDRLDAGVALLQERGYRVRVAPHARDRYGHMAGTDADRAADLHAFYADSAVDVLWCAGGGSSACRLWPRLDWDALAALPPKMLVGYSDITSLHIPFQQKLGGVTLHGPMVSELGRTPLALLDWELSLLQGTAGGEVPGYATEVLRPGLAEGPLCGGCLSLIVATLGTPYQIDARDKLLLIEDVDEAPHRIERYLVQLREAGILGSAAGVIVGQATHADDTKTLPMRQIWEDLLGPLGKPVVLGFPFGHVAENHALPLGARARLDAGAGTLTLLETAVETGV